MPFPELALRKTREYLLIEQSEVLLERHQRRLGDHWESADFVCLDDIVTLESLAIDLPLAEVYRRVF